HWLCVAACGPRADPTRRPPRVLDFSALWAGPLCAELRADAGWDGIKIESARGLDASFAQRAQVSRSERKFRAASRRRAKTIRGASEDDQGGERRPSGARPGSAEFFA